MTQVRPSRGWRRGLHGRRRPRRALENTLQVSREVARGLIPLRRILGKAAGDDDGQVRRNVAVQRLDRRRVRLDRRRKRLRRGRPLERPRPCQQLVEQQSEGELIGAVVHLSSARLFRRHVASVPMTIPVQSPPRASPLDSRWKPHWRRRSWRDRNRQSWPGHRRSPSRFQASGRDGARQRHAPSPVLRQPGDRARSTGAVEPDLPSAARAACDRPPTPSRSTRFVPRGRRRGWSGCSGWFRELRPHALPA